MDSLKIHSIIRVNCLPTLIAIGSIMLVLSPQSNSDVFQVELDEQSGLEGSGTAMHEQCLCGRSLLRLLDSRSLLLLAQAANIVKDESGSELDFTSNPIVLRVEEVLGGYSSSIGDGLAGLDAAEMDNLAVSLATDILYIMSSPQSDSLAVQRNQYLKLLDISQREFEIILAEYGLDQETETEARRVFEETVKLSLSYFDQPRLAALSDPRLDSEMATLMVDVAAAVQADGRSFLEKQFPQVLQNPHASDRERKMALSVSMRSAANYLASVPFQVYVVDGTHLGQASSNHHLNRLATIAGITAQHKKDSGGPLFVVDYYYRPDEVSKLVGEAGLPSAQD